MSHVPTVAAVPVTEHTRAARHDGEASRARLLRSGLQLFAQATCCSKLPAFQSLSLKSPSDSLQRNSASVAGLFAVRHTSKPFSTRYYHEN